VSLRDIVNGIYKKCLCGRENIFQLYKVVCEPVPETPWTIIEWYFNSSFNGIHRSAFVYDLIKNFKLTGPDYTTEFFCLDAARIYG
jgi:hypothetical protein